MICQSCGISLVDLSLSSLIRGWAGLKKFRMTNKLTFVFTANEPFLKKVHLHIPIKTVLTKDIMADLIAGQDIVYLWVDEVDSSFIEVTVFCVNKGL